MQPSLKDASVEVKGSLLLCKQAPDQLTKRVKEASVTHSERGIELQRRNSLMSVLHSTLGGNKQLLHLKIQIYFTQVGHYFKLGLQGLFLSASKTFPQTMQHMLRRTSLL